MATARHIIKRAFSKAKIRSRETPLTAAEIDDGLDALNDIIKSWSGEETIKGCPAIDDVGDTVQCQEHEEPALKAYLAISLCEEYGRPIGQGLATEANQFLTAMINANTNMSVDVEYPSTLPLGSGNRWNHNKDLDDEFFPENTKSNF